VSYDHLADLPLVDLPPAFVAFHEQYYLSYCEYATLLLGNKDEAIEVVDDLFTHLAINWARLMGTESPMAKAWAMLKIVVTAHLDAYERQRAVAETALFRKALDRARDEFEIMESTIGLYTAIAGLSGRLFDVVVLRYVLGYPNQRIAAIMAIEETTVRTHLYQARRKLARDLGIDRHHQIDPS
jgi:RNA polymerase sigma-70 factor (ECF subfamily)